MTRKQRLTHKFFSLESLEDRLCLSSLPVATSATTLDAATQAHLSAAYGQLPLSFEVNKGQTNPHVNFVTQGAGYTTFLTPTEAVMELQHGDDGNVVAMKIVGANAGSRPVGLDKQAGVSNDFVRNDPSKWRTNIANYARAGYQNVYRGINVVYHGDQQQLEYDFVVEPGASPGTIRLAFGGALGKSLDAQGNLVLHTSGGDIVEHAPVAFQVVNGVRHSVASRFVLGGGGQVGFQVGQYDHDRALVIDPVSSLSYSTYLGGDNGLSRGYSIAVDGSGDAYVTGLTESPKFPGTKGAFQSSGAFIKTAGIGAFVTKFNAAGSALVYSTFLGAAIPTGIAVDSAGNAYLTGSTGATNFPTKNPLQATNNGGGTSYGGDSLYGDAFVTKLNATGSALVYSTYLGGTGDDQGRGIAVDGAGNAYVTGYTDSTNFPTTTGSFQPVSGVGQAFVAKLNQTGSALAYSTYLGSSVSTAAYGIAVDGSGNAYVTGYCPAGVNFQTTPGAFVSGSDGGAIVVKLNATGSALVYAAELGGSEGSGIAVDRSGNAYITGIAPSPDFPTTPGAFQTTFGNYGDAFVTELNAAGTALVYSTRLGGSGGTPVENVFPGGIAVDGSGNIHVTGITVSTNFPTKNAMQATYGGGEYDAFVAEINPSQAGAASLVYSTYLGGDDQDEAYGIAVDGSGNAYVTGFTYSLDFPTKNAYQSQASTKTTKKGTIAIGDAFVTKITFK
jgi:Beta-propeller repeat